MEGKAPAPLDNSSAEALESFIGDLSTVLANAEREWDMAFTLEGTAASVKFAQEMLRVTMPQFDHLDNFAKEMAGINYASRALAKAVAGTMPRFDHLDNFAKEMAGINYASRVLAKAVAGTMPRFDHLDELAELMKKVNASMNISASGQQMSRLVRHIQRPSELEDHSFNADALSDPDSTGNCPWLGVNCSEVLREPQYSPPYSQTEWVDLANFVLLVVLACPLIMMFCADIGLRTDVEALNDAFVTSDIILSGIVYSINNDGTLLKYVFYLPLLFFLLKSYRRKG